MPFSAAQATQWAEEAGFALLPIAVPHLLVAQAVREELTLLSSDEAFQDYGCLLRDARN